MTSPGSAPATDSAPSHPITEAEYTAALDTARQHFPWAEQSIYERLRADVTRQDSLGGRAFSALRRHLKVTPSSAMRVLFCTLQAAKLALATEETETWCLKRAAAYQGDADIIRGLLDRHDMMAMQQKNARNELRTEALGLPIGSCNALKAIHQQLLDQATFYANAPKRLHIRQKNNPTYLFLRSMREKLFSDSEPNHEGLRLLAEVALGVTVTSNEVKGALRRRGTGGISRPSDIQK